MLRRNGPVVKSVESVLRLEGSLWWERFVKEVEPIAQHISNRQPAAKENVLYQILLLATSTGKNWCIGLACDLGRYII